MIVEEKCESCGTCLEMCRYDAIVNEGDRYFIDPLNAKDARYVLILPGKSH